MSWDAAGRSQVRSAFDPVAYGSRGNGPRMRPVFFAEAMLGALALTRHLPGCPALRIGADDDQDALLVILQARLEVHAVGPDVEIALDP